MMATIYGEIKASNNNDWVLVDSYRYKMTAVVGSTADADEYIDDDFDIEDIDVGCI